jgi:hypothetical protein
MSKSTTLTKGNAMIKSCQIEIEEIQQHMESLQPGMPTALTAAASPGNLEKGIKPDAVRQGDLYLIVIDKIPKGYKFIVNEVSKLQLVLGQTQGARHCLDSFDGVKLYYPVNWTEESLEGPCFVLTEERKVLHPTHGTVTIAAGHTIRCCYQREYDKELMKERRTRD